MTDPFTTSLAAAIVTGVTRAVGDGTRALLTKLATLVRERFGKRSSDLDTLEAACRDPGDQDAIRRLSDLLSRRMHEDPAFARDIRALWHDIRLGTGQGDGVTNIVQGPVHGSVVQARDVRGGIEFNEPPRSP